MEESLAPPPPPLVAPTPAPLAAAAVLTRRRSHLDSASYRTLSRIFSHCLHLQPSRPEGAASPEPLPVPAAANPIGGDSGDSPQAPRGADRRKDVEEEAAAAGSPTRCGTVTPERDQPAVANPTGDPGEIDAPQCSLEDVVVIESTSSKVGTDGEELAFGAGLMLEDEALNSMKACLEGEVDESVEGAMVNDDGHLLLDAMMSNLTGLIDDVGAGAIPAQSCAVSGLEPQNSKASEELKQLKVGIEDSKPVSNSDSGHIDTTGFEKGEIETTKTSEEMKQLGGGIEDVKPMNDSDRGQIDASGFEEGEIEGEFQDLDSEESADSDLGDEDAEDGNLIGDIFSKDLGANKSCVSDTRCGNLHLTAEIEGNGHPILNKDANVRDNAQVCVTRAQAISYDEVVDWNQTPLPDNKASNTGEKRKRHLTEERKAKKTKNKRIKRAKQRTADGVKRVKLTPVVKPKKPCHFYDHGKCQQGNNCKFSHDFTPSTKSKPCKHFACGSCLKGDECPYDHELSKYECHNYKNKGMCIRGDKCKFSHVIQTTEGSPTSDAKILDASLAYEKPNLREQSCQKTSAVHNGHVNSAPTKQHSILKSLAGVSINSQNVSSRVPKGVQFLPFNKGGTNLSSLHPVASAIEKQSNANGTQHQHLGRHEAERPNIEKTNGQNPVLLLDEKNSSKKDNMHPCSDFTKASLHIDSTATPGTIQIKHEVSEASRILQEFLFGADS